MRHQSLQSFLKFLLAWSVVQICNCERKFISVKSSEVICRSNETLKICRSAADDCLLVEVHNDTTSLTVEESESMTMALQQLATEDRLDDTYPDDERIRTPLSDLSHRLCPVSYTNDVKMERVPMLIVHATCENPNCRGDSQESVCLCREVQQFRQVYRLQSECRFIGKATNVGKTHGVFVKAFDHVSVNCAAYKTLKNTE